MAIGLTRYWVRAFEAVALALFLAIALLSWRLSKGPLPLDAISPYIENALAGAQPGVSLKIGHASLNWTSLLEQPTLTVEDVRAVDRKGVVAVLPRMVVQLSVAAFMRGTIAPEAVVLTNPTLRVARHADGTFTLGFEPPSTTTQPSESEETPVDSNAFATGLISALTQPADADNRAAYLSSIAITDTRLVMFDEKSGRRWLVPKASLTLSRAGPDVVLNATLPVIDDEKPWSINVSGRYAAQAKTLALSLKLDGFRPAGIAGLAPQLAPLSAIDLRVSGTVSASLMLLESAARMDRLDFDLKGDHGLLRLPAPAARDYPVRSLAAKGSISSAFDRIALDQLHLEMDGGDEHGMSLTVSGLGDKLNTQPVVSADIAIDDLSLKALKSYWPAGIKENARSWIAANLNNGGLSQTHMHVALAGPSLDALAVSDLDGSSVLSGVSVNYLKGLPQVEDTFAVMRLTPGEVTLALSEGHVPDSLSGKGLLIHDGLIRMFDLGSNHEQARVTLNLAGDLGEAMRLIDYKPLGYASAMGIDPSKVTGGAKVHLDFTFPLISDLKLDQLRIAVTANVDGAKVPDAALGQPLTDSHLSMALDGAGMDVKGTVALAGIPATIVWRENFGGGAFRSRYEVDSVLGNAARSLVGLTADIFAPPYIDGPARTHMVYVAKRDGTGTIESEADLKDAALFINQFGWHKDAGIPAQATVTAKLVQNHLAQVSAFHLTSGDVADISGSASFTDTGAVKSLVLAKGDAGDSHFTGELILGDDGVYHLKVRGAAFNSTYFWSELGHDEARENADASKTKTPLEIQAAFDRMWLAKDGDFRNVRLIFRQGVGGIEHVDFASNVDGAAPFTFILDPQDGKRLFHGASTDGGGVVRAVGLFSDFAGGNLTINGELLPDGSVKGKAEITNLKVTQAPVLARLLSVASLGGIVDELRGKGISFKLLRVPFTYKKSMITVHNGEMFGSGLGLTGKGTYSFADSIMDFDGTIIPAYTINNALSSIPLLGHLLTGSEKGGGVLAMTYQYRGDVATAQPSVNPLAALTPGILRHIFDIFRGPRPKAAPSQDVPAESAPNEPAAPASNLPGPVPDAGPK
ncbi:MAG: hypothetical protein EPO08_12215 [Rhodospirillaceae bacterium]|nr:MAG: hypothetical protein EPO08_12215 [Rhodospirillaceae bacterium]